MYLFTIELQEIVSNNFEDHQAHVKYTSVIFLKVASPAKLPLTSLSNETVNFTLLISE